MQYLVAYKMFIASSIYLPNVTKRDMLQIELYYSYWQVSILAVDVIFQFY